MKLKLSRIIALALLGSVSLDAAEKLTTGTINVISATPLPSIGLPLDIVPANIQVVKGSQINTQNGVSLADYISNNLQSVNINQTQGNPFQPDISFRGFTASPLLGQPQGMSVFVDGVRVNEPFGDVVNWDLIPSFAIQGMQVIPGSNPVYGLNTLGGAIAVQTKDGRLNPGAGIEMEFGSWGRKRVSAEYGGVFATQNGSFDYFVGGQHTDEDGWRKYSPSYVNQTFAKVGWQNSASKINLSFIGANNNLTGNGLTPVALLSGDRDQIHTRPDITDNFLRSFTLNASNWINDKVMLSANAFNRLSHRKSINGDLNDGFNTNDEFEDGYLGGSGRVCETVIGALHGDDYCAPASMNRSNTKQRVSGFTIQAAFNQDIFNKPNQLIAGLGYENSKIKYNATEQKSDIEDLTFAEIHSTGATRFFDDGLPINLSSTVEDTVKLTGKTNTYSIFATDTLSLTDKWHLTAAARYNHTKVNNVDTLNPAGASNSLTGTHIFNRLNPSIGVVNKAFENLSVFANYSESSRAPTSIELGCANRDEPCLLPNAMAGDPPLNQVVSKTYDFGLRGSITDNIKWNSSVYRTRNQDDIQFIWSGSGSRGYFNNVGQTLRTGLDLGLNGRFEKLGLNINYSYINAEYDSTFQLYNAAHRNPDGTTASYTVRPGDEMPGISPHQLKMRLSYELLPRWNIGLNTVSYSNQYVHGNESNDHTPGSTRLGQAKIAGYTVVNLDTQYKFDSGFKLFAKAINIFDKDYDIAGRLGETQIKTTGWQGLSEQRVGMVVPGAPRALWIGVRYDFGGNEDKKD
jgi:outer membrane receptor protein involved in Fe transport